MISRENKEVIISMLEVLVNNNIPMVFTKTQVRDMIKKMKGELNYYEITTVHKEDIEATGDFTKEQIDSLTESDMERIADKLGNAYVDDCFWIDLPIITQNILENKTQILQNETN